MKVRVKVTASPVFVKLDSADYAEAWQEKCEEEGDLEEGEEAGEAPVDFMLQQYTEDLESGNVDLAEVLENASVEVELAE